MAKSKTDKPPPVAVAIVDTHCFLREAIGTLLEQRGGYRVAWMGATYKELDAAMDDGLEVALVLVALGVGEEVGFTTLERLRDERPALPRAAYVHRHDEASIMRAYRCGAQALLHDTVDGQALLSMLGVVLAGGVVHSPVSQGLLLENPDGLTERDRIREKRRQEITPKLWGVLMALGKYPGHSATMLGRHLGITGRTVEDHLKSLYALFGVRSRTALVVRAIEIGLIPL